MEKHPFYEILKEAFAKLEKKDSRYYVVLHLNTGQEVAGMLKGLSGEGTQVMVNLSKIKHDQTEKPVTSYTMLRAVDSMDMSEEKF